MLLSSKACLIEARTIFSGLRRSFSKSRTVFSATPTLLASASCVQFSKARLGIFFRIYVDTFTGITGHSDAELLSRLEYQGAKSFYFLTRKMQ
jgi:hypothetical protein